jgi:hypothetical protein
VPQLPPAAPRTPTPPNRPARRPRPQGVAPGKSYPLLPTLETRWKYFSEANQKGLPKLFKYNNTFNWQPPTAREMMLSRMLMVAPTNVSLGPQGRGVGGG